MITAAVSHAAAEQPPEASNAPVTPASATAQDVTPRTAIRLAYGFRPGQFVHYQGSSKVQYRTELGDQYNVPESQRKSTSLQTNDTATHFRVVTVDESGMAQIEPVVDQTRMTAKMHGKEPVEFDSSKPETPSPQFQAIREAIGRPVARFQISSTGKLTKAIIIDETAPASLRDAAMKLDTRFPFLPLLPSGPVAVGEKWREEYSVVALVGGLRQPIPMRRIYELHSVADARATIKFKTLTMVPVTEPEVEKQIVQQTPTGTIVFDIERGLVISYSSSVDRTVIGAFGAQSLLRVTGQSTESLIPDDQTPAASEPAAAK